MRLKIIQDLDQLSFGWLKGFKMKYSRHIVFFLFINLLIVFVSIFFGNYTRKLENTNNTIKMEILKSQEQLKINKIEYSFYNNPDYLKRLHNIYFSLEQENLESKIVSIKNIKDYKNNNLILVDLK